MKVCILGATFDTANMGVSMLTAGAIRCVVRRFPDAQITICDYGYEGKEIPFTYQGRIIPVELLNFRFSKKFYLPNNVAFLILLIAVYRLVPLAPVRRKLLLWNRYLNDLMESDLVLSIAYGDSFSDIYGLGRLLYVSLPQILMLLAGKRFVMLPQTIGPFRSRIGKAIARCILSRSEIVYSRDHMGLDALRGLIGAKQGETKFRFCYDLAFEVDPKPPVLVDVEGLDISTRDVQSVVGVNVSGLLMMGGYTRNNMFDLKVRYDELIYKLIEFVIEQKAARVLLIPHVFDSPGDLESDSRACDAVFDELKQRYEGRIGVVRGSYSYDEIKNIIGRCDFFVRARMHACIAALSQNIPTVPIAYSDKFAGMMQSIGFGELVADPRHMDAAAILETVDKIYEKRAAVGRDLAAKMPVVKQRIRDLSNDLSLLGKAEIRQEVCC
jgi:polysaccharide pyruvyl transferase WcaK-like protein